MRKKPSIERYYRNTKTGQYAKLEGSPLAIKDVETRQWKRQKVRTKRVSKREYYQNVPRFGEVVKEIGMGYKYRFGSRSKLHLPAFHEMFFTYQGMI